MTLYKLSVALLALLTIDLSAAEAPVVATTNNALSESLTLEAAMQMASENNASIAVSGAAVEQARELAGVSQSGLRPQIYGKARYQQIDSERASASGQGIAERDTRIGVALSQSVYDEALRTRTKTSTLATRQSMHQEQVARLDAMKDAGEAFLRLSLANATRAIEGNNLELTLGHLKHTRDRFALGAAGQDEVLRWEAEEARQRGNVLSADAAIQKLRLALNRAMGANADEAWQLQPPTPADGTMYFLDDSGLLAWLNSPARVAQFREFSALKAMDAAPELHQLDNAIAAQRLVISQKNRGAYIPVLAFNAGYDRVLSRDYAGDDLSSQYAAAGLPVSSSEPPDNEWQFNVTATVPLWEGGARKHDVAAEVASLNQLELTRVQIAQQIEQRALAAVYSIQSSHPKIGLARIAADRAKRSLQIVGDKYQRGATQIIDVLDAQNQALRGEIGAAVAQTEYLLDLVDYQRAIAWFEKFQSSESRNAWVNHFKRFIGQQQSEPADPGHKH